MLKNSFAFSNYIFSLQSVPFSRKNFRGGVGGSVDLLSMVSLKADRRIRKDCTVMNR